MTIGITLLGATGSIGKSTLDVIGRHPDRFRLVAATANRDVEGMLAICERFRPECVVMADEHAAEQLASVLDDPAIRVEGGAAALDEAASLPQTDAVMAAIVGAAGLSSSLAAARAGKRVLLANKEALVMSGHLFMAEVRDHGAELLPIDSEHNAIFQSMPVNYAEGLARTGVRRILLTASGGPFRQRSLQEMAGMTPAQAVAHPNWSMGRKISVDSATMMNKGLEIIEACWLFDTPHTGVTVVVHPESIIHSMVEYVDGSVICQMGNPDMRIPIAHAMGWPERIESGVDSLDLFATGSLHFEHPDESRFPCLRLAREAAAAGGTASTILNAANEIAVEAFLDERLGFLEIADVIEQCLSDLTVNPADSLAVILDADAQTRMRAAEIVAAGEGSAS